MSEYLNHCRPSIEYAESSPRPGPETVVIRGCQNPDPESDSLVPLYEFDLHEFGEMVVLFSRHGQYIEGESVPCGQTSISASQTPMDAFNTSSSIGIEFSFSWAMQERAKPKTRAVEKADLISIFPRVTKIGSKSYALTETSELTGRAYGEDRKRPITVIEGNRVEKPETCPLPFADLFAE